MFILTTSYSKFRNHVYDINTLEDIMLGLMDEDDAKRIAAIAGNMKIGDSFANDNIYLKCMLEEDTR